MIYNCLIVDDEPLARKVIEKYLHSFPQFKLLGSVGNATEAFELLHNRDIHLIFLDIDMPSINGLQFIQSIKKPPPVIFTTAYSEYAAESYELEAIDYLLKPISLERYERSINKFLKKNPVEPEMEEPFLLIKQKGKLHKVFYHEILFVEACKDYLIIQTSTQSYIKHMTMTAIEMLLPNLQFIRVHRSFIVALQIIKRIENNTLAIGEKKIPVGKKYKKNVIAFFKGDGH